MICFHKSCLLLLLCLATTTTRSSFPEQQQSADGQASLLSPTTADNVDSKPVVLGKVSSALEGEELTRTRGQSTCS